MGGLRSNIGRLTTGLEFLTLRVDPDHRRRGGHLSSARGASGASSRRITEAVNRKLT